MQEEWESKRNKLILTLIFGKSLYQREINLCKILKEGKCESASLTDFQVYKLMKTQKMLL